MENEFKVVKFELTPATITDMVEKYNSLILYPGDKASYKEVHAAKMILTKARTGTDKHRKSLGADARTWITDVNQAAKELTEPLLPVEAKLKGMLDAEDQRVAQVEKDRLDSIDNMFGSLDWRIKLGQEYGLTADKISKCIEDLKLFPIIEADFQEKIEQAETMRKMGIETLERILANAIAREEEAKKLEAERAEFEKTRIAERERQAEKQRIFDEKEEELRIKNEKLEADKQRRYLSDWYDAILINRDLVHAVALKENAEFDCAMEQRRIRIEKAEKEKLKADKARVKLVAIDKGRIDSEINQLDELISGVAHSEFETKEAYQIMVDLYSKLKTALLEAEQAVEELV